jgi:hypothetical protein
MWQWPCFVHAWIGKIPTSLSLIFPNYLTLLSMYLMLIFCRGISTDGGEERPGYNTDAKAYAGDTPQRATCLAFS